MKIPTADIATGSLIALLTVAVTFALSPSTATASENPKLTKYFREKITQVENASENTSTQAPEGQKSIVLTDFNIDFTGQLSFGITDVFKLSISTELDFVMVPDETN